MLGEGDKVDITVSDGGGVGSTYIDFAIPGNKPCNVVIDLVDNRGRQNIYTSRKVGGIRIRQKVEFQGKAKAILIVDGKVIEERSL